MQQGAVLGAVASGPGACLKDISCRTRVCRTCRPFRSGLRWVTRWGSGRSLRSWRTCASRYDTEMRLGTKKETDSLTGSVAKLLIKESACMVLIGGGVSGWVGGCGG
jgi:hypothetical protein